MTAISLLTRHKEPRIRLAAAHALAKIGNPRSEAALIKVVGMTSDDDRSAAINSLLQFAESVMKKHDNKAAARRIYPKVFDSSDEGPLRNVALRALGTLLLELE